MVYTQIFQRCNLVYIPAGFTLFKIKITIRFKKEKNIPNKMYDIHASYEYCASNNWLSCGILNTNTAYVECDNI